MSDRTENMSMVKPLKKRIFSYSEGWQHLVFHYFCKAMDSFRHC